MNGREIVELSRKLPLQVGAMAERDNEQKERVLDIALHGANERTRVHLIATHALPRFSVSAHLDQIRAASLSVKRMSGARNLFLAQREIGEELRYVLERAKAKKFIGNSLQREHKATAKKNADGKGGRRFEPAQRAQRVGPQRWRQALSKNGRVLKRCTSSSSTASRTWCAETRRR